MLLGSWLIGRVGFRDLGGSEHKVLDSYFRVCAGVWGLGCRTQENSLNRKLSTETRNLQPETLNPMSSWFQG